MIKEIEIAVIGSTGKSCSNLIKRLLMDDTTWSVVGIFARKRLYNLLPF